MEVLEPVPTSSLLGKEGHVPKEIVYFNWNVHFSGCESVCSDPVTQMRKEVKYPPCAVDEKLLRGQSC